MHKNRCTFCVGEMHVKNFTILSIIKEGKFSQIHCAVDSYAKKKCVAKISRRDKEPRRYRCSQEVKVLHALKGVENVIELVAVVYETSLELPIIILEYVRSKPLRELLDVFTYAEVRYYLNELLKAIDFTHSKGIMHRDINPDHILIDRKKRKLRLIDWGMAEFYHPGKKYSCLVGTSCYKAPELLLQYQMYDYAIDMWSVGCVFASMMFMLEPFFCGSDSYEQMNVITMLLGSEKFAYYIINYKIQLDKEFVDYMGVYMPLPWNVFIFKENEHLITPKAVDLLGKLLRYDHAKRLTASQAMEHDYFDDKCDSEYNQK